MAGPASAASLEVGGEVRTVRRPRPAGRKRFCRDRRRQMAFATSTNWRASDWMHWAFAVSPAREAESPRAGTGADWHRCATRRFLFYRRDGATGRHGQPDLAGNSAYNPRPCPFFPGSCHALAGGALSVLAAAAFAVHARCNGYPADQLCHRRVASARPPRSATHAIMRQRRCVVHHGDGAGGILASSYSKSWCSGATAHRACEGHEPL